MFVDKSTEVEIDKIWNCASDIWFRLFARFLELYSVYISSNSRVPLNTSCTYR